ncbi:peptidoglycan-binding protein [Cellulomonas timonensis]|uniref:peptidoglycan-binding protein n=1 Tax=Cellulomonas timonensis TaxID=1689271 RepID=UPI00082C5FA2|nr:peptidoglycan-binding protein [Cellulomonas timonensis]
MTRDLTPTRRRSRRAPVLVVVGVVTVAAVTTAAMMARTPAAPPRAEPIAVETATVTRGDLVEQVRVPGTLAHGSPRELGTSLTGVVTALPAVGTTVAPGGELFRVNDAPVVLMRGEQPAWRAFASGMKDGADVRQLEENLSALGFLRQSPDQKFTHATATAVKRWQKSLGLEQTGTIDVGQVVFSPADVRVQEAKAQVGDEAGPELLAVTKTVKEVQVFLDTSQQALAPLGTAVTLALPGGAPATGVVVAAGAPVERDGATGTSLKIPLTIALDDPQAADGLDNVSVTVLLTQNKGADLLLVPVIALLAEPGGGFAVEVTRGDASQDGTASRRVSIELGAFADGLVAVVGGDLSEGDTVVVAK